MYDPSDMVEMVEDSFSPSFWTEVITDGKEIQQHQAESSVKERSDTNT